jgi:uncharacterized membrane protein YgcG
LFVAAALAVFFAGGSARATPVEFKADPESASRGVASYQVERSGDSLDITVLDDKGNELQSIAAVLHLPEGVDLDVKAGREDLTMALDFVTGRLSIRDNTTGETAAATPRPGKSTLTEGSAVLLDAHSQAASLAAVALEQTLINLGLHRTSHIRPQCPTRGATPQTQPQISPPTTTNSATPKDSPGVCTGPYETGTATASTAAIACEEAQDNTNENCSNGYCYGCCRILPIPGAHAPSPFCSCSCIFTNGDWCLCTVSGQACGSTWTSGGGGSGNGGGGDGGGGGGGGGDCRLESGACSAECFSCPPAL